MSPPDRHRLLSPNIAINLDRKPLPATAMADLRSLTVIDDIDAASTFAIELVTWDIVTGTFTWIDDELFAFGGEIEIQIGYEDDLKTQILGEITGLEPEFAARETPKVVIRGYDRRHRLMRGRKTRSFVKMKDSDIVTQIAKDAGLQVEAEDTKVKLEYVLQHDRTDWEFLQQRSRRIGYELTIDNKTLSFHSQKTVSKPTLTLDRDSGDLSFFPRLTTMNQVSEIDILGWDPKSKKEILSTVKLGSEKTLSNGSTLGAKTTETAFGATRHAIVNRPIFDSGESDRLATSEYDEMTFAWVTGEGICHNGNPELRSGTVIELAGFGQRFSGYYYITSVSHFYFPKWGYRTEFSVRRNAT